MDPGQIAPLAAVAMAALVVVGIVLWYFYYRKPRDLNAPHRLGREMGLQQLSEGDHRVPAWYGGHYGDHDFGVSYANLRYGNYGSRWARGVERVVLSLRVAVALNVAEAQDIVAYFRHGRSFQPGVEPEDFEHAFDRRNTDRLSEESREALLRFAQNHGSLRLRDRATAPADLFAPEALPDAQIVLVHDRPGYQQPPDEIYTLLDALLEVAAQLESDPALKPSLTSDAI